MALTKFWLKHGPGSPGAIAKRMARSYVTLCRRNPESSHEDLLRLMLAQRYTVIVLASPERQRAMLDAAEGHLANLIVDICKLENPRAFPVSPEVYTTMMVVINDMIAAEIPAEILDDEIR